MSYHRLAPSSNGNLRRPSVRRNSLLETRWALPGGTTPGGGAGALGTALGVACVGAAPMTSSVGHCVDPLLPRCTRRPTMTCPAFARDIVTSQAPGAGASTWESSDCNANRSESEDTRWARSPPKVTSLVTHCVRSKKSSGKAFRKAFLDSLSSPFSKSSRTSTSGRAPRSLAAVAARSAWVNAALASCFCCTSAAATPAGGGGSCANTCSDPSSLRVNKNATSRLFG